MHILLRKKRSGLTLIEMLITVTIIAVLAVSVFATLDPRRRLNTARNAKRWTDVATLVDAMKAYQADHDGTLCMEPYVDIDCESDPAKSFVDDDMNTVQIIGEDVDVSNCTCAGLDVATVCGIPLSVGGNTQTSDNVPTVGLPGLKPYLAKIPADPLRKGSDAIDDTRYYINYDPDSGVVSVGACDVDSEEAGGEGAVEPIEIAR